MKLGLELHMQIPFNKGAIDLLEEFWIMCQLTQMQIVIIFFSLLCLYDLMNAWTTPSSFKIIYTSGIDLLFTLPMCR